MRPLGFGETLDAGFKLLRLHFKELAIIVLLVMIPLEVLNLFITTSVTDSYEVVPIWDSDTGETYSDEGTYIAGQIAIFGLTLLFWTFATVAVFRVAAEAYRGRPAGVRDSLMYALKRSRQIGWTSLLLILGIGIGLVLCVLPGVWLWALWSVALPALLVEGVSGTKALGRSQQLVKDRWWATFGRLFAVVVIALVIDLLVSTAIEAVLMAPLDSTSLAAMVAESAAAMVGTVISTPLISAVIVIVYFDLRVRKEGFDLSLLAERMGPGPPAASPPESGEHFGGFAPPGR